MGKPTARAKALAASFALVVTIAVLAASGHLPAQDVAPLCAAAVGLASVSAKALG